MIKFKQEFEILKKLIEKYCDDNRIKEEIKSAWNSSSFKIETGTYGKTWTGTSNQV